MVGERKTMERACSNLEEVVGIQEKEEIDGGLDGWVGDR